ncbi:MAG: DUF1287 domain-containing protein [Actinomycetota bacterium]
MKKNSRRTQLKRSSNYKYLVIIVIILAFLQFWVLKGYYQEVIKKIPLDLFQSSRSYPISELVINKESPEPEEATTMLTEETPEELESMEIELTEATEVPTPSGVENSQLSDAQKDIVLRSLEMLEENIEYGYELYPETGYPTDNIGVSTDIIAMVLRDCGYDLMELIYEDMLKHSESYPMDIIGRDEPIKYIDFRHVFFQETFFKRHALELDTEYDPEHPANNIQWQAGDIVYFQLDEENPHKDLGGFISPHTNENGVPLVIMTSKELGKLSAVDVLLDYEIVGHYRYPYPEDME